jgi:hypothetical protein
MHQPGCSPIGAAHACHSRLCLAKSAPALQILDMAESFAVLVLDMSRAGEDDDSRVIDGFATFEAARAYAEARTRASVEELRKPDQPPEELRTLWHIYGEDCLVLGGGYSGREFLDDYIARPAAQSEIDWVALAPEPPGLKGV